MGKTFKANDDYSRVKKNKFKSRRFKKKLKYNEAIGILKYANISSDQQENQRRD